MMLRPYTTRCSDGFIPCGRVTIGHNKGLVPMLLCEEFP